MAPSKRLIVIALLVAAVDASVFDQTFSVRSSVIIGGKLVGNFDEIYSPSESRARIAYNPIDMRHNLDSRTYADLNTFYLDLKRNISLEVGLFSCRRTSVAEFIEKADLKCLDIGTDDKLFIGPAKLLLLVESNRQRLVDLKKTATVRNIQSRIYSLKVNPDLNLEVYYPQNADGLRYHNYPSAVNVYYSKWPEVVVDFRSIEKTYETGDRWLSNYQVIGSKPRPNMLAFGPLKGCSALLNEYSEPIFESHRGEKLRFSFKAIVEYPGASKEPVRTKNIFVAYNEKLLSMRVDSVGASTQLMSFKQNRLHHMAYAADESNQATSQKVDPKSSVVEFDSVDCGTLPMSNIEPSKLTSAGEMLAGSEKFVYIGKASAKGMEVDVYETSFSSVPAWLDPPLHMDYANPDLEIHKPKKEFVTLLYVKSDSDESRKLPIELSIFESLKGDPIRKFAVVSFREFAWDLDSVAPNGDRPSELFSLKERCTTSRSNKVAQVEANFVSPSKTVPRFISGEFSRDQSILAILEQKFNIPVAHVYDLDSRVIKTSRGDKNGHLVAVSFRMAEHDSTLCRATLTDATHPKELVPSIQVGSFAECYLLASQSGKSSLFGYSKLYKRCMLDYSRPVEEYSKKSLNPFPIFLYDLTCFDESTFLIEYLSYYTSLNVDINFIGERVTLASDTEDAEYNLAKMIIQVPRKGRKMNTGKADEPVDTDSFVGFGLSQSDNHNSERGIPDTSDGFAHCRAICASKSDCESFSFCIVNRKSECVISTQSFRSNPVVQTIVNTKRTKPKIGSMVKVRSDEGNEVNLVARHTCELHNKQFMQFMIDKRRTVLSQTDLAIVPAPIGREFCAKMCFEQNVKFFKARTYDVSEDDFCSGFNYIDAQKMKPKVLEKFKLPVVSEADARKNPTEGYCFFSESWHLPESLRESEKTWHETGDLEVYEFNTELLYEKQHGVSLYATKKTLEERTIYDNIQHGNEPPKEHMDMIKQFLLRGENSQALIYKDARTCANLCAKNIIKPWPDCQSFDVYEVIKESKSFFVCRENSITLQDALVGEKDYLISRNNSHVVHYEPLIYFQPGFEHLPFPKKNLLTDLTGHISSGHTTLVVLVGLVTGVIFGVYIAKQQVPWSRFMRRESTLPLDINEINENS